MELDGDFYNRIWTRLAEIEIPIIFGILQVLRQAFLEFLDAIRLGLLPMRVSTHRPLGYPHP